MRTVVILGTGGTIATRTDASGVGRASEAGEALAARLPSLPEVDTRVRDVFVVNSFLLGPERVLELAGHVQDTLADTGVAGVVVTHGTDTTEETAYALDLMHDDERPVVLTGAQRPADAADADGPRNLADAVTVAADPRARGLGVLVVFDGAVYPARGTRKTHTLRPAAFATPDAGPLGYVRDGRLVLLATPLRAKPLPAANIDLTGVRVDIAACYPGGDAVALEAFASAGARGLVLAGTGAGNANPEIVEAVRDLHRAGVVIGLSTRVDAGPVAALYGNGGGADLLAAGAVALGTLRPPQARMLLTLLLGALRDPDRVRAALPHYLET